MADEIPPGLCQCGCGMATNIAPRTHRRKGWIKGQPLRYIAGHQGSPRGPDHYKWQGGRYVGYAGYVWVQCKGHPSADQNGYVAEHRLVMEQTLGRYLAPEEVVHHKDGNKRNNDPANLELMPSNAAHARLHGRNGRWTVGYDCCVGCGSTARLPAGRGLCRACYSLDQRHRQDPNRAYGQRRIDRPRYEWSTFYPCCAACGTTERPYGAQGMCRPCYDYRRRHPEQPDASYEQWRIRRKQQWALDYPACVCCGTTARPHQGRGLCRACYQFEQKHNAAPAKPYRTRRITKN